jgi:maltooligosyltrehalose trehalohydrolase
VNLRVWAPSARTVRARLESTVVSLKADGGGWWTLVEDVKAGTHYQFILDDGEPLADPRSLSQPEGVFGPSAVIDHSAFEWHDAGWESPPLDTAIIYELHIGTFTPGGTFDSAIPYLDHLVALGVTHVEIMPVNEFAGTRGWGYDGVLLWAPHHGYGGPDGLKRFVDACHARGLGVLLDVVYNHFGPEGSVVQRHGPYTTDQHRTPWGDAINLDQPGSDEVRRFFCDNALMWLRDYHCDGLRVDAIHALHDHTALPFLEQLATETRGRAIAESNLNDPRVVRSPEEGGFGFPAQWNDDFHHAAHVTLTGEHFGYYGDFAPFSDLARALEHGFVYQGQYSRFRQRVHGRPVTLSGHQLVASLQNHDQVGNRADGARLSQLISAQRCRAAATLLLTSPFIPLLFQGEEWGATTPFPYFCDHRDPDLVRAVREGRRQEFAEIADAGEAVPDPQDPTTFASARLCWEESTKDEHAAVLAWYKQLIATRRAEPDLLDGNLDRCNVRTDATAGWIVVTRGRVKVACNLGTRTQSVPLGDAVRDVLAQSGVVSFDAGDVVLGPDAVALVRR